MYAQSRSQGAARAFIFFDGRTGARAGLATATHARYRYNHYRPSHQCTTRSSNSFLEETTVLSSKPRLCMHMEPNRSIIREPGIVTRGTGPSHIMSKFVISPLATVESKATSARATRARYSSRVPRFTRLTLDEVWSAPSNGLQY